MFQHTKLYLSFQNLSLGFILKIFLKFRKFQPRYSYKIYSYTKKRVYLIHIDVWSHWSQDVTLHHAGSSAISKFATTARGENWRRLFSSIKFVPFEVSWLDMWWHSVNLSQLRVEPVAFLLVLYFLLMPNFVFGLQCKFDTKKAETR